MASSSVIEAGGAGETMWRLVRDVAPLFGYGRFNYDDAPGASDAENERRREAARGYAANPPPTGKLIRRGQHDATTGQTTGPGARKSLARLMATAKAKAKANIGASRPIT